MGERIFSEDTILSLREFVLLARDRHGFSLPEHLRNSYKISDCDLNDPDMVRHLFDGILEATNWCDRDKVRPVLPILEDAYAESPKSFFSLHERIDIDLARDGFRIKDGQMLRLVI
ncbi:MAG: hypothetical protein EOP48_15900 [Sphingobacteriales bacterium]|nr:MAG: hypothetical protein EOP48_15900 [Sphingobacteriales bacterium]